MCGGGSHSSQRTGDEGGEDTVHRGLNKREEGGAVIHRGGYV